MLTTRSVKNEERAVQLECCLYSLMATAIEQLITDYKQPAVHFHLSNNPSPQ